MSGGAGGDPGGPEQSGRVAIVTGAAHGLGRAITLALAREGARVYAWDIRAAELEETALGLDTASPAAQGAGRGTIVSGLVDVTDTSAVTAAVAAVLAAGQGIHILVNCAGGVLDQVGRPVGRTSTPSWP